MGASMLAHDFALQSLTCYTFDSGKRFSVSCKVLDLLPVNLRNLHLHLTKKSIRQPTTSFVRCYLKSAAAQKSAHRISKVDSAC